MPGVSDTSAEQDERELQKIHKEWEDLPASLPTFTNMEYSVLLVQLSERFAEDFDILQLPTDLEVLLHVPEKDKARRDVKHDEQRRKFDQLKNAQTKIPGNDECYSAMEKLVEVLGAQINRTYYKKYGELALDGLLDFECEDCGNTVRLRGRDSACYWCPGRILKQENKTVSESSLNLLTPLTVLLN